MNALGLERDLLRDTALVTKLRDVFKRYDIDYWYAPERLRTGDSLEATFVAEISTRDVVVPVVSRRSGESIGGF